MDRLLCIINNMNMGGAETFLMKVYRTIDRSRYQMDFCISVTEKCDYEDEIVQMGGRIFRIVPKSENQKEFKKQLTKIIKDNTYKSVLRITSNAAGFWDLKIAKKAGAAHTIARSSNADDGSFVQSAIHHISRALWMKYVDVKIAPSVLAAEYTFGKKAVKSGEVKKLNNGLDLSVFRYDEQAGNAVRKEFDIPQNADVIGHIGRFNTQKNHLFLIEIFNAYLKNHPGSYLMLTGTGNLEEQIKSRVSDLKIQDHVVFTGLRKDIPALLSAFDLLMLPSLYEGMPNVIIEAQACGLPCILSDTVTREADLSGGLVYLPLSDEQSWAAQAEKILRGGRISADMIDYDIRRVSAQFCDYCFN